MGVFDRQIASAKSAIEKKGQIVAWQQITNAAPADSNKPWLSSNPSVPTFYYPKIAFFSFNAATPHLRNSLEVFGKTGELIQGKLYGLMAAQTFVPTMKDVIIRFDQQLSIDMIDKLQVNEELILYTIGFVL